MIKELKSKERLDVYKQELGDELNDILRFWTDITPDLENGGFYGKIDSYNHIYKDAPKGSVLNTRILWTFSAAYNQNPDPGYLDVANRAFNYINDHMIDGQYGGVYWSVDCYGNPLDTKKQVYAIAFAMYALSEYYMASGNDDAKMKSIGLFHLLVEKAYDPVKTGYFEAFSREWGPLDDLRLSDKDANEKKTMNTHLHVLEGYTNLYRIWPDKVLKSHIGILLTNFFDYFIDQKTNHLVLFFDENWNRKSDLVSYGHDIEATWLMLEAAEVIEYDAMAERIKNTTIQMAEATIKGLDADGGLWYEYEPATDHLIKEKHWWVQAEAMVGFYNAWQISGDDKYLELSAGNWQFVKNKILDKVNGEWFWGVNHLGYAMRSEDKVGIWKCPYHNSRACMEIIRRISELVSSER